jgi:hypothetical protein
VGHASALNLKKVQPHPQRKRSEHLIHAYNMPPRKSDVPETTMSAPPEPGSTPKDKDATTIEVSGPNE